MIPTKNSSGSINFVQKFMQISCLVALIFISLSCEKKDDDVKEFDWNNAFKLQQYLIKSAPDSNYYIEPGENIVLKFKKEFASTFPIYENENKEPKSFRSVIKKCELIKKDDNKSIPINFTYGKTKDSLIIDPANILKAETNYLLKVTVGYEVLENDSYVPFTSKDLPVESIETLNVITSVYEGVVECTFENISIFKSLNIENNSTKIRLDSAIVMDLHYDYLAPKKVKRGDSAFFVKAIVVPQLMNNTIPGNVDFKQDSSITQKIIFKPSGYYELNTNYTFLVKIKYLYLQNNTWLQLYDENNKTYDENYSISFSTDNSLNLDDYVSFSYPINKQLNFYKGEYAKGYLMFRSDITTVISRYGLTSMKAKFSLSPNHTTSYTKSVSYNAEEKTAWFDMPTELENNKIYKLEITNNGQVLYTSHFRCSYYNKIAEKFKDTLNVTFLHSTESWYYYPQINLQSKGEREYFDKYEMFGYNSFKTVNFIADLENTTAYTNTRMNELYQKYESYVTNRRDKFPMGIPPVNNVFYFNNRDSSTLSEDDILDGEFTVVDQGVYLFNKLPYYLRKDLEYIVYSNFDNMSSSSDAADKWGILNRLNYSIFIKKGNYPFFVEYMLPGKDIVTSKTTVNLINSKELSFK